MEENENVLSRSGRMKRTGILNRDLVNVIAGMGHTDKLVICDAGLPIPDSVKRIDLSLVKGFMPFLTVLEQVLKEMVVEKAYIAAEMKEVSPDMYEAVINILSGISIETVSHEEFKKMTTCTKGIVRTGECTPYANIILISGVDF